LCRSSKGQVPIAIADIDRIKPNGLLANLSRISQVKSQGSRRFRLTLRARHRIDAEPYEGAAPPGLENLTDGSLRRVMAAAPSGDAELWH
jgi:hypothetical protein